MIKHVYIHIPFCKYICTYCDFCKKYIKNQPVSAYLEALEAEIKTKIINKIQVETIYIGGGTPSALSINQLKQLQQIIAKFFTFAPNYEFTFECNPDDVSTELLTILKAMGVNRISMGVQVLNDKLLHELKREHTVEDVEKAIELSTKFIENVSCDFIFNLPNQQLEDIDVSLMLIEKYHLSHVSYYGLILEENTILDTMDYQLQTENTETKWYYYIQSKLKNMGYIQYEISNYAKSEAFISQHNLAYWQQKSYYGFGLGASGYEQGTRFMNTKNMRSYLEDPGLKISEDKLTTFDVLEEKILLNLRTQFGIEKSFLDEYNLDYQNDYFEVINNLYVRIKPKHLYLSSEIIVELLLQLERNLCKDIL